METQGDLHLGRATRQGTADASGDIVEPVGDRLACNSQGGGGGRDLLVGGEVGAESIPQDLTAVAAALEHGEVELMQRGDGEVVLMDGGEKRDVGVSENRAIVIAAT